MTKNDHLKDVIARETAYRLGGRSGAKSLLKEGLNNLGVHLTGGCGAGNVPGTDGLSVQLMVATKFGLKKIVLKISVEDI